MLFMLKLCRFRLGLSMLRVYPLCDYRPNKRYKYILFILHQEHGCNEISSRHQFSRVQISSNPSPGRSGDCIHQDPYLRVLWVRNLRGNISIPVLDIQFAGVNVDRPERWFEIIVYPGPTVIQKAMKIMHQSTLKWQNLLVFSFTFLTYLYFCVALDIFISKLKRVCV